MNPILRWLRRPAIANPVDRRNAPFIQGLLLFFGIFVPINKAVFLYAVGSGQFPRPDSLKLWADVATDVLLVAAAWVALWRVRKGLSARALRFSSRSRRLASASPTPASDWCAWASIRSPCCCCRWPGWSWDAAHCG
ncbi:hypothetical protein [Pseudoxanthomonas sp. J35]|uniref:hypothetical protein n=1 Tax=Pseudoxanthomonas sp. J35 TaxID=935852 RepID=UPI0018DCBDE9|nr:hypothetical protein [Pseudoxanthomonas sp. J35]